MSAFKTNIDTLTRIVGLGVSNPANEGLKDGSRYWGVSAHKSLGKNAV